MTEQTKIEYTVEPHIFEVFITKDFGLNDRESDIKYKSSKNDYYGQIHQSEIL